MKLPWDDQCIHAAAIFTIIAMVQNDSLVEIVLSFIHLDQGGNDCTPLHCK